jgi:hypothetical protein
MGFSLRALIFKTGNGLEDWRVGRLDKGLPAFWLFIGYGRQTPLECIGKLGVLQRKANFGNQKIEATKSRLYKSRLSHLFGSSSNSKFKR